jgi:SAM-dependent methyltransferase
LGKLWDGRGRARRSYDATIDDEPDHGLHGPAVLSAWASLLLGRLRPPPARLADLGCGTGSISVLLAENGYQVSGVDISPRMVERARRKAERRRVTPDFQVGNAAVPPFSEATFDALICRHVLWALPDPGAAPDQWLKLLRPYGQLLLVEGRWQTGGGLSSSELLQLLGQRNCEATLSRLDEPVYWGGPITDERYMVVSHPLV